MSLRVIALSKNINNLTKYNHVFNRSFSSIGGKHIGFIGLGKVLL